MFTGLVESQGIITRIERMSGGVRLEVYAPDFGRDMAIGDSVAVDGACLTITRFIRGAFLVDVSEETLARTTLGGLKTGSHVNLERALRMSDRFGGHFMSGHVDGVGRVAMRQAAGNSTLYTFIAPESVRPYLVPKGSLAVNGISLTIADVTADGFTAAVIPHTEESTTLGEKRPNDEVNMEADVFAKYIAHYVARFTGKPEPQLAPPTRRPGGRLSDMLKDLGEGS
jgi:riboflavin synthase